MSVVLPPEAGRLFKRAIETALAEVPAQDADLDAGVSAETRHTLRMQRRADAAVLLAESFLAHGPQALKGGDRQQIVVHVDAKMLQAGESHRCELDEGPAIAVETARRFACDASRVVVIEDERGEPLDVGRKTRTIPPAMRRALDARDEHCIFPGCTPRPPGQWHELQEHNHARGIFIDPHTATSGWRGERIDYGIAVEVLANRRKRAR